MQGAEARPSLPARVAGAAMDLGGKGGCTAEQRLQVQEGPRGAAGSMRAACLPHGGGAVLWRAHHRRGAAGTRSGNSVGCTCWAAVSVAPWLTLEARGAGSGGSPARRW